MVKVAENRVVDLDLLPGTQGEDAKAQVDQATNSLANDSKNPFPFSGQLKGVTTDNLPPEVRERIEGAAGGASDAAGGVVNTAGGAAKGGVDTAGNTVAEAGSGVSNAASGAISGLSGAASSAGAGAKSAVAGKQDEEKA
ncbi:MAG: hypothetical protein Q9217_003114 [Psora testacea]